MDESQYQGETVRTSTSFKDVRTEPWSNTRALYPISYQAILDLLIHSTKY